MAKGLLKARSYCDQCPVECDVKAKKIERISERNQTQFTSDNTGVIDVLFLTDTIEHEDLLQKLNKYIQNIGIKNYAIVPAIGCKTKHFLLPSPTYSTYTYCRSFNIEKYNPKVVVPLGRALFYFTKGSVFSSWREFKEFIFNDTFFYPHIKSRWKGRIYPVGFLSEIFDFTSFENYFFKFQIEQVKKHIENYENEKFTMPEFNIQIVDNYNAWLTDHKEETKGSFDTETNNLNVFVDDFKVGCIQCSFDGKTAYVLPSEIIEKRTFSKWLQGIYQIWANGKYDCKALNRVRISGHHVDEDIPLVYHILNTERESNSIKVLSWFIGFGGYEDELDEYKKKYKISNYLDIPPHILYPYAGIDAIVTYLLEKNLVDRLVPKQTEVYDMYREIILPVIPVFQKIEEEGLLVDQKYVQEYHNIIINQLEELEEKIYALLNKKINISSIDELGKALEEIGLPDYGRTKKGLYKTGEESLVQWENDGYEVAKLILRHRALAKLDSTYIGSTDNNERTGIYQYIMSDGRVHGNIMPALTDSLRSLCVTGDTLVTLSSGDEITIKDMFSSFKNKEYYVKTHLGNNKKITNCWDNGLKEVFKLTLEDGKQIRTTENHKIYTKRGWIELKNLDIVNDEVLVLDD